MYSWIWKKLPGPKWLKAIEALLLIGLVVAALLLFVFPMIDGVLQDPTIVSE